jgi:hypothetical protein
LLSNNIKIKIYRTIILHVILYGCEMWSPISREEGRLREFESSMLRRIFGPKSDEVMGVEKTTQRNNMWVIKLRRMRWVGCVAGMGERRGVYRVLVGKPEGRRPLGRPRHRWEDNNVMEMQKVGCGGMDWIGLAQHWERWLTLVNVVMNFRVPCNVGNFLTS